MTTIRIAPPTNLAVDLATLKGAMRIDGNDMDAQVMLWAKGVIAALEHEIGQCLIEQGWRVTLDDFPSIPCWFVGSPSAAAISNELVLPHPVLSVTSVQYLDEAGIEQTMAPAAYRVNRERYRTTITPALAAAWPATSGERGAVMVDVVCGYGSTPESVPENIQLYIVAKMVEQFDPATRLERDTVQSAYIDRLLDACRSYT